MHFPSTDDINRLIEIQNGDCGFFIVAVYSFIEKYMKSHIESVFSYQEEYDSDRFAQIIYDFRNAIMNTIYNGWIPEDDYKFFKSMTEGKNRANDVRHNFTKYDKEEAIASIRDLLHFFELVDQRIEKAFEPLKPQLNHWMQRKAPDGTSSELNKINANVVELQKDLPTLIHESEEYQNLIKEIEEISNKCKSYLMDKNNSVELAEKLKEENEKLKEREKIFNEKFKQHEKFRNDINRMSLYTRTRKDFETNILRLTEEQQKAVDRIKFKQDYLIKGSAGTGKSLVLLKTLEKLINEEEQSIQIYFITYTRSLVNYNSYIASLLDMGISEDKIITADKFFGKILHKYFDNKYIDVKSSKEKLQKVIHNVFIEHYSKTNIDEDDIYEELTRFIWPNIVSEEEYIKEGISRKGMKRPLSARQRQIYWAICKDVDHALLNKNEWHNDYAKYKVALKLKETPLKDEEKLADYIFIDESQDLSLSAMFCTKAVTKKSVVMARDIDQTINQIPLTYSRGGLNVTGTSTTLTTNFRNTILINNVAEKYRMLIPDVNKENKPVAFRVGLPVSLIDLDPKNYNSNQTIELLVEKAKMSVEEYGYDYENICIVVAYSSDKLITKIINELGKKGLPAEKLKDKDYKTSKKISVTTIQSCKGLDFPVVILLANSFEPYQFKLYDNETADKIQRNMLYVACTRAMDELTVISRTDCENVPINDLKNCITEINNQLKVM